MNQYTKCQFDNKKLRTNHQKTIGYCNNTCLLLDIKLDVLVIKQKLEAEEKTLDDVEGFSFSLNNDYLNSDEFRLVADDQIKELKK